MRLVEKYCLPIRYPTDDEKETLKIFNKLNFFFEILAISSSDEIEAFISSDGRLRFANVPYYIRLGCYRLLILQNGATVELMERITADIKANQPQYSDSDILKLLREGDSSLDVGVQYAEIYARKHHSFREYYPSKLVPFLTVLFLAPPKSMMDFLEPMQYDGYGELIFFVRLLMFRIAILTEPFNERYLDLAVKDPCSHSTSIIEEEYVPRLKRLREEKRCSSEE